MNIIFVISSPAGVGKTTICSIASRKEGVGRVVTHTTRAPRPEEENGKDYYFVSKDEFEKALNRGEFVEYALVHGNYYGTSKRALIDVLNDNKDALLAIDVQGARNVMRQFNNAVSIFMLPPSFDIWFERITKDGVRKDLKIRLKTALNEFNTVKEFDFCIINDDLEKSVATLESIMKSQHNSMNFVKQERDKLVKQLIQETKKYLEV